MLSFDIQSLARHAVAVDGRLAADDPVWQEGDPRPSGPVRVAGRLSAAGTGRFYWHGRIEGDVVIPCRRCLTEATVHVTGEEHLIFAEPGDEEADDPDVFLLDPRATELDLRPAVREQWVLNVPGYALCRENCQGLCPSCGHDLNGGACGCPPAAERDSRWAALRQAVRAPSASASPPEADVAAAGSADAPRQNTGGARANGGKPARGREPSGSTKHD